LIKAGHRGPPSFPAGTGAGHLALEMKNNYLCGPLLKELNQSFMTMTSITTRVARKEQYTSPLTEEIVISFEECLLQGSLKFSTTSGTAGADPEYHEIEGEF
jgi:hypothetical protein